MRSRYRVRGRHLLQEADILASATVSVAIAHQAFLSHTFSQYFTYMGFVCVQCLFLVFTCIQVKVCVLVIYNWFTGELLKGWLWLVMWSTAAVF